MKLTASQRKKLALLVLVFSNGLYLYIGGLIFSKVEKRPKPEPTTKSEMVEILDALKTSSYGKRVLGEKFDSQEIVEQLEGKDLDKLKEQLDLINDERNAAAKPRWSFSNSLFFATTIVTTIGYGNLAPATLGGRMFCIIYALIGIPLTLMLLAVVGNVIVMKLNNACAWVVTRIRSKYLKDYEFEAASEDISAPVWLALPIIFLFLAIMSTMYSALEGWDFGTSLYFIFITFTTIGFGDIVPSSQAGIWINTTLLYVGLSIVSITINLCASGVAKQMQKTGKYIKILEYFQDNGGQGNKGQSADEGSNSASTSRRRQDPEHFEMEKLEDQDENGGQSSDSAKLNAANAEAGKTYGSVEAD